MYINPLLQRMSPLCHTAVVIESSLWKDWSVVGHWHVPQWQRRALCQLDNGTMDVTSRRTNGQHDHGQ